MSQDQKQGGDRSGQLLDLLYRSSQATDLQGTLSAFLQGAGELLPGDGIAVMRLEGDHLEAIASLGTTVPLPGLTLPASQMGAARAVLDSGRVLAIADVLQDGRWQQVPGEEQVRAWLGAPLRVEEQTIGLVEWTAREPGRFGQEEMALAGEIARLFAPIFHQVQMLEDARRRLRELLEPRLSAMPRSADLSTELQPLVREALELAGARHAFVFLLGEGGRRLRCVAASGEQRDRLSNITLRGDGTLGGWSVPIARPADRPGAGPSDREVMASLGIETTLILPIRVAGEQVGMIGVAEPRHGRTFGRDAIRLMAHLASQAALVVERFHRIRPEAGRYDYELVIQSSPLGIGVLTLSGEIRVCNPALAALLSRPDRSLVGRKLADFLLAADGRRLGHALEEVAISGQRRQVDVRTRSLQGEQRHLRLWLALAHISDDAGGDLVVVMEDVTPLKILEQERVEHLRELREKHALLQELDQVRSRFVSNVSHELRTPLAVIKLYATLARKGRPEKQAYYLQTIEQETHRLETMVENILDLTRMDRHALRVHAERLSVAEIVAQVLEVYEEAAVKRGIELRNHVPDGLPPLWADKNHLIQMLTNLVDNALKYTPRGGQVWVAARELASNGRRMLEVAVGDTGVGIPEDEQEKVFDRFYRGSNNTPGSTGTGLGLAIVQELMAQHGGRVTLKSRVGEGSTFALQFPLSEPV